MESEVQMLCGIDDARQCERFEKIGSLFAPGLSKKLAPFLRQAFRQGLEAASRNDDQNPYVPNSHLYHAWIAGWAMLARGWWDGGELRLR